MLGKVRNLVQPEKRRAQLAASLPREIDKLRQRIVPAPKRPDLPVPTTLPPLISLGVSPTADVNNVLVIIPTANKNKVSLIRGHLTNKHKLEGVNIVGFVTVPATSEVGEQPYDVAGPRGAVNRVVNAVGLVAGNSELYHSKVKKMIAEHGVGTLLVGSVENFIRREKHQQPGAQVKLLPVDYGFVVFCRIDLKTQDWKWEYGISDGVTAPVGYWQLAEMFGFEDRYKGKCYGKVTVGDQLAKYVPGLDGANWHLALAGKCRYEILREAMAKMQVPPPRVAAGAGAGAAPAAGTGHTTAGAGHTTARRSH